MWSCFLNKSEFRVFVLYRYLSKFYDVDNNVKGSDIWTNQVHRSTPSTAYNINRKTDRKPPSHKPLIYTKETPKLKKNQFVISINIKRFEFNKIIWLLQRIIVLMSKPDIIGNFSDTGFSARSIMQIPSFSFNLNIKCLG